MNIAGTVFNLFITTLLFFSVLSIKSVSYQAFCNTVITALSITLFFYLFLE